MNNLICPHCRTEVPRGAHVCTGRQAELKYGAVSRLFGGAIMVAVVAGCIAGHYTVSLIGWGVCIAVAFFLCKSIQNKYEDRVVFKRAYRH